MTIVRLLFFLLAFLFSSCNETSENKLHIPAKQIVQLTTSKDSVLSNDYSFFGDSLLSGYKELLFYLFKKYDKDSCIPQIYQKRSLREDFEGIKSIGDINNDGKTDSVFILNPLNRCEYDYGQSYYFTDTSLPRIISESYCCHSSNIFVAPDIDEDGIYEVGFYYSSCTGRYKALVLLRLKDKQWEQIATSTFDILTQDPEKIKFKGLVQKISKNQFSIKNFIDSKQYWDTISLN